MESGVPVRENDTFPMVSKVNAIFRHLIGSERHQSSSGSRKRPSDSLDDVGQDILETPQAKRSRTSNHSDDSSHSRVTTPLVKVATWIQQKASTFGETYFFRPVGNLVQNSYPSPLPGTSDHNHLQHSRVQAMSDTPCQQVEKKDVSANQPVKVAFKQPDGVPHHKQTSNASHHQVKQTHSHNNGRQLARDSLQRTKVQHENKSSAPDMGNPSTAATGASKRDSYTPVREKLFPHPKRRVVVSHAPRGRAHFPNHTQTVDECVRLKERQQYKELLEHFRMGQSMASLGSSKLSETTLNESKPQPAATRPRPAPVPAASATSTRLDATGQMSPKERVGLRVLPHQFSTQHDIREAVRQRLHVPTSQLSPGTPEGEERPAAVTPAQPDFDDSSPPPTIIASKPGPRSFQFQQSLQSTPYLAQDWVHDLKARFESSVRVRQREIEEEKSKLQRYEERRAKGQAEAKELINARIKRASRLPGAVEDAIYHLEEKEPEDSIAVIDDVEEEEEDEEEEDDGVEEEEEEELPMLTDEMEDEISRALNPNPANEGLATGFRLTITRRDMQTLAGLNWLNDEVMNFYFEMLMSRSKGEDYPNVHSFNTFFYPKLINSGYASLRRWTKKVDIFTKDLILVPVHLGMHWCLAVVDFRNKTIVFYDSMGSHNQQCLDALRDYVVAEHADKKKQEYSMDGWSYYSEKGIPQQLNGSDCGMFACKYAEYISRDAPITFTQHDMPYFRRRMVWEILHTTLL